MNRKTFIYYFSIKELYGEEYIAQAIDREYSRLLDQLSEQYKDEFTSKEIGLVIIPITCGIERLELVKVI